MGCTTGWPPRPWPRRRCSAPGPRSARRWWSVLIWMRLPARGRRTRCSSCRRTGWSRCCRRRSSSCRGRSPVAVGHRVAPGEAAVGGPAGDTAAPWTPPLSISASEEISQTLCRASKATAGSLTRSNGPPPWNVVMPGRKPLVQVAPPLVEVAKPMSDDAAAEEPADLEGGDDRLAEGEGVRLDLGAVLAGRVGERVGADLGERDVGERYTGGDHQQHSGSQDGQARAPAGSKDESHHDPFPANTEARWPRYLTARKLPRTGPIPPSTRTAARNTAGEPLVRGGWHDLCRAASRVGSLSAATRSVSPPTSGNGRPDAYGSPASSRPSWVQTPSRLPTGPRGSHPRTARLSGPVPNSWPPACWTVSVWSPRPC